MQRRPLVLVLSIFMAVASQEENLMREMAAQPNSGSYSQVRISSTRRNGTYDPYSLASNPALANHRLVAASAPSPNPSGYTLQKTPAYGHSRPSAVEVQSAIQESMRQQQPTVHRPQQQVTERPRPPATTPPQESSFYGNYYPQYSDTFSGPTSDLQRLPLSAIHGPNEGEPEVHESSHHEMDSPNDGVRDYHRDVLNVTFSHPMGGNAATQRPLPEYEDDDEQQSAQAAAPGSDFVYGHTLHTSQQYLGNSQNDPPNALDRRVDEVAPPTTTDCGVTCQLFREEFRKSQMLMKTAKPPTAGENALLHTTETKTNPPPTSPQPVLPHNHPNFSAPATNEIFSISDALIPPASAPSFQNGTMSFPGNNAFPAPMGPNQFNPSGVFVGQGLPNPQLGPMTSPLSLQTFAHLPGNMQGQPSPQQQQQPQQVMQNNPRQPQPQFMQQPQQPVMKNGPQPLLMQNGRPVQPIAIPAGSVPPGMSIFQAPQRSGQQQQQQQQQLQSQNRPVFMSPQSFMANPSNSGSTMSPFRSPMVRPMQQLPAGQQTNHNPQHHTIQQSVGPQPSQGNGVTSIPGPMGIHIPIPPKSVPAHTVMGPPPGVFPPSMDGQQHQRPQQQPPRRNGGFLDSIMNFFGRNQNRARSLEDGGILVLDESGNYTIINETMVNMTINEMLNNKTISEMLNSTYVEGNPLINADANVNVTDYGGILKRVRRSDLLDTMSTEFIRWFSRLREDSESLFDRPIFPRLRRLIKDTFASRYDGTPEKPTDTTKAVDSSKFNRRGNLWSMLLKTQEADSRSASLEAEELEKEQERERNQEELNKKIQNLLVSRKSLRRNILKLMNQAPKIENVSPTCALDGDMYCTQDNTYPTSLLSNVLSQVEIVGVNLKCNESTNATVLNILTKRRPFSFCQTQLEKIRPLRARNQLGFWKIIVNIPGICQQSVVIRKCKHSCVDDSAAKGRKCKEETMTRQLLAYDRRSGFHTDTFDFPSGCRCNH